MVMKNYTFFYTFLHIYIIINNQKMLYVINKYYFKNAESID